MGAEKHLQDRFRPVPSSSLPAIKTTQKHNQQPALMHWPSYVSANINSINHNHNHNHNHNTNSSSSGNNVPPATNRNDLPLLLNKLYKHLSPHQQELVKQNPGSLMAVARAIKMAIVECQYQMRNEPWDCPIHGFSVKPAGTFGILMSRSFKETSFIQSLLSSAITHSITRACTESTISTCSSKQAPHSNGHSEDIEFGQNFAQKFMDISHELLKEKNNTPLNTDTTTTTTTTTEQQAQHQHQQQHQQQQQYQQATTSNIMMLQKRRRSTNSLYPIAAATSRLAALTSSSLSYQQQQLKAAAAAANNNVQTGTMWKERRLRYMINAHNDEVGRLVST